jgi:isoleucyl-tRNA synthetase
MNELSQEQIAILEQNGSIALSVEGQEVIVEVADVEIISEDIPGWLVSNEGNLTVALEVELTDELRNEGMARELINRIQNMRKDSGLEITDRINVIISDSESIRNAVDGFADYIKTQVLADSLTIADNDGQVIDLDELKVNIKVEKNN